MHWTIIWYSNGTYTFTNKCGKLKHKGLPSRQLKSDIIFGGKFSINYFPQFPFLHTNFKVKATSNLKWKVEQKKKKTKEMENKVLHLCKSFYIFITFELTTESHSILTTQYTGWDESNNSNNRQREYRTSKEVVCANAR